MGGPSIEELQAENQHLRDLVVSLSATLLRNIASGTSPRPDRSSEAEHLVCEADQCFRCARLPGLKEEIAAGLEAAGHELMKRAVAIDTELAKRKKI
jgi:hypothetical protein